MSVKGDDRRTGSMIFINDIDNNKLNSGAGFWSGYQEKYEKIVLSQEIILFGVGTKTKQKQQRLW